MHSSSAPAVARVRTLKFEFAQWLVSDKGCCNSMALHRLPPFLQVPELQPHHKRAPGPRLSASRHHFSKQHRSGANSSAKSCLLGCSPDLGSLTHKAERVQRSLVCAFKLQLSPCCITASIGSFRVHARQDLPPEVCSLQLQSVAVISPLIRQPPAHLTPSLPAAGPSFMVPADSQPGQVGSTRWYQRAPSAYRPAEQWCIAAE